GAFVFWNRPTAAPVTPADNVVSSVGGGGESNGTAVAAEPIEQAAAPAERPIECPYTRDRLCTLVGAQYPGAGAFCEYVARDDALFAPLVKNPSKGPTCLKRKRYPKATARVYAKRHAAEMPQTQILLEQLSLAACGRYARQGCADGGCASLTGRVTEAVVDLLAKRFARSLHNPSADRAVPDLDAAMPHNIEDPRRKTASAWLKTAMSVSCAWEVLSKHDPSLGRVENRIARDFDRLKKKLPAQTEAVALLKSGS
ncbi:MAG: hypothetical protein AAF449_11050, partial [Myxococcota bacterium]